MPQTIVILKRAHFFSIDNDIIDVHAKKIGAIGVAIYTVLARHANRKTGECWPAIARIQRTLDLGRSTVKRYLQKLESAGLITVEERWSEEGDRTSNRYTLLSPEPDATMHPSETQDAPSQAVMQHEGGGFTEDPPPVLTEGEGGSGVNPHEPDPRNQKKETTQQAPSPLKTPRQQTCPHPEQDVHRFGDGIEICFQCYLLLGDSETRKKPRQERVEAA